MSNIKLLIWCPDLRCWLTNRRWCQLRSQCSAGTLASNQLLPNASLERDGKALIDLVDGLSSGSMVLVNVTNGNLADHDARLEGEAVERLPGHGKLLTCNDEQTQGNFWNVEEKTSFRFIIHDKKVCLNLLDSVDTKSQINECQDCTNLDSPYMIDSSKGRIQEKSSKVSTSHNNL